MREREHEGLRKVIEEQSGARTRLPMMRARVVRAGPTEAGKAESVQPRYAIDVQPILPDGGDNPEWPVLGDVELPVVWAGSKRGVYALPAVGSVVRIGFYHDDPSQPYVDAQLGYGHDVQAATPGEFVIALDDSVQVVLRAGVLELRGSALKLGKTAAMRCLFTGSPHPSLPLHITDPEA